MAPLFSKPEKPIRFFGFCSVFSVLMGFAKCKIKDEI